jgi:DNA-binding transcriptional MerR regulator
VILPEFPDKKYFTISEVADLLNIRQHILRYWEQEFPVLSPRKADSGHRTYTKKDLEVAARIFQLIYIEKYTVAGARKKLASEFRHSSVAVTSRNYGLQKLRYVRSELKEILEMVEKASKNSRSEKEVDQ